MSESLQEQFRLSPLIRGTLITVYLALVFPLPLLAPENLQPLLWIAAPIGFANQPEDPRRQRRVALIAIPSSLHP